MLLTIRAKVLVNGQQKDELLTTMERFNAACDYLSMSIFDVKYFSKFEVHKVYYHRLREMFGLSAQMTVEVISKVTDSYKKDKSSLLRFKPHGAVLYDHRSLSVKENNVVSISALKGRIKKIPITFGNQNGVNYLSTRHGATQLLYIGKKFYLAFTIEVSDGSPINEEGVLGVDLGIVNLSSDSDGNIYSGDKCRDTRSRYVTLRSNLQIAGTKSAKKHLRKICRKEANFKRNTNHNISKKIVTLAEGTKRAIALEDLTGIRSRFTASKTLGDICSRWSFGQLSHFIEYKAVRAGVPVRYVNPKDTSRTCSVCNYVDKNNRKTQKNFQCLCCGHRENADINAAKNIGARAAISQPIVVRPTHSIGNWNDNPAHCV